ncbi:hypothetical protein RHGRI_000231 [Rhododendron griersonianum]|uniref:Pectinesterase inhibitor domain-containing protein n=1 Tax=Rhododendron griersonianum TaxID=479676 RepID=A0AAV6LGV8_9ERIC|nr:hypothetical protein RHGRI_000231 [Rhododendron griersonianum]
MRPYPRSATSDLPGIAKVTLDLALSQASTTKSLIGTLLKQVSDPANRTTLTDCSKRFDRAILELNAAKKYLVAKDYTGVNVQASLAEQNTDVCSISLSVNSPSPQLRTWTVQEGDYCNILCEASGLLFGGDYYFCNATADLPDIAKVTVSLALSQASTTKSLIATIFKQVSDPANRKTLTDCSNYFDRAILQLNAANKYLVAKDYNGANVGAAIAERAMDLCSISLKVNSPSPKLRTWTVIERDYCNILCETSGLLLGVEYLCNIWTQLSADSTETAKQNDNDDSIQKVCSKVVLPDFCIKTLKPYPRSATADLTGIAKVSLDLAQSRANTTKSLILTLFKRVSDPTSKAILTECTNYFNKAIGYLNEAKKYLAAKDYDAVNNRAEVAQSSIDDCNLSLVNGPSRDLRNRVVDEKKAMASTSNIPYILSLFLLFSCIRTQLSADSTETAKQNDDSIQKVCSKVVLPDFCIKTLKPYPRSATADLTGIAKVSLDLAQSRANTTKSLILTLFKRASDPTSKAILTECTNYFNKAIGYLNEAKKYLAAKDYDAVIIEPRSPSQVSMIVI